MRALAIFLILCSTAYAVPPVMNNQGRIAVGGANVDGTGYFKFAIVDAAGTNTFWANDGTANGEPAVAIAVAVTRGHYSALLGAPPMVALPAALFAVEDDVRLRVWYSSDNISFTLLSPDRRITPAAYALHAASAASVSPSYETGAGSELTLGSIGVAGELVLDTSYSQAFASAPGVDLGLGWTVTANDESGFTASAEFVGRSVDSSVDTGSHASLAVVAGRPAIAYRDNGEGDIMFARSTDASGSEWPASAIVRIAGNGSSDVGEYASLAVVAARPAVAYYDASGGDLKFVRAENEVGSAWPTAVTVDGVSANVGRYASLAVVAGNPAISYTSPNTGELMYAWAADAEGASWQTVAVEGSLPDYRQHSALADVGGKPAIATYNSTDDNLRFVYLSGIDPSNPAHWTGIDVDTAGDVGRAPSLEVIGGNPSIAYESASGLKFARANNAAGSSWGSGVVIDAAGAQPSLAEVGGRPAVSYYDAATGDLNLAWAADGSGSLWPAASIVSVDGNSSNMGTGSSLALVDGLPAMAYRDELASNLKYASLPVASWSVSTGGAEPILASGVKDGGVTAKMLSAEVGVWRKSGDDLFHDTGRVGVGRVPASNSLEVEGSASKTTAGAWLANSDRRIKTDIRDIEGALARIEAVRLVDFQYTDDYRAAHPSIDPGKRYPNVVAQEFAEVFPDWVGESGESLPGETTGAEAILQVDTYPLTIYSAAAIQELAEENRSLEDRVAQLERLVEKLAKDRE